MPDGTIVVSPSGDTFNILPEELREIAIILIDYAHDADSHTDYIVQQEAAAKNEAPVICTEASLNITSDGGPESDLYE